MQRSGPPNQGKSADRLDPIAILTLDCVIITEFQHINTVELAYQKFWGGPFADFFLFRDQSGWKAAWGEDEKVGWVKKIPIGQFPKGYKTPGGRTPAGKTVKVFVEYLGPPVA